MVYRRLLVYSGTGRASWKEGGGGALFPFWSGVTEVFCKIESKFVNSSVLSDGFVNGSAKKSWF